MPVSTRPRHLALIGHHDLDGMVSAAVAADFLRVTQPQAAIDVATTDFHLKAGWATLWSRLESGATPELAFRPLRDTPATTAPIDGVAIVDFPAVPLPPHVFAFYADHHPGAFELTTAWPPRTMLPHQTVLHDLTGSCAMLLADALPRLGYTLPGHLRDAAAIAHLVDTAGYRDVVAATDLSGMTAPVLDAYTMRLSATAAADLVVRLGAGVPLEHAVRATGGADLKRFHAALVDSLEAVPRHTESLGPRAALVDWSGYALETPPLVRFSEYRDPAVHYSVRLTVEQRTDHTWLVRGAIGRSPWATPLGPNQAHPDLGRLAAAFGGGGGHPYAAGFRCAAPTRAIALAEARAVTAAVSAYLMPLPPDHPYADRRVPIERAPASAPRRARSGR